MAGSKVFQVVGYQNSGKTTLMEKLIGAGAKRGLAIGTIKHHGHGGKPDQYHLKKDSDRHKSAGAVAAGVEGGGNLLIEADRTSWSLNDILSIYERLSLDLILVEGYKKAEYPKVVLVRNEDDLYLLNELKNIQAVISWIPVERSSQYEVFSIEELPAFIDMFYSTISQELG